MSQRHTHNLTNLEEYLITFRCVFSRTQGDSPEKNFTFLGLCDGGFMKNNVSRVCVGIRQLLEELARFFFSLPSSPSSLTDREEP